MKRGIIATLMTIVMVVTGMICPELQVKAEAMETTGYTVSEMVALMKECQDNPYVTGITCCHGVWITYSQGRVLKYVHGGKTIWETCGAIAGSLAYATRGSE